MPGPSALIAMAEAALILPPPWIRNTPSSIDVLPVYVLLPVRVNVPSPIFVKASMPPASRRTLSNVLVASLSPTVSVPLPVEFCANAVAESRLIPLTVSLFPLMSRNALRSMPSNTTLPLPGPLGITSDAPSRRVAVAPPPGHPPTVSLPPTIVSPS